MKDCRRIRKICYCVTCKVSYIFYVFCNKVFPLLYSDIFFGCKWHMELSTEGEEFFFHPMNEKSEKMKALIILNRKRRDDSSCENNGPSSNLTSQPLLLHCGSGVLISLQSL